MKTKLILAFLFVATLAQAQTLHMGQPVDNASSTSSILGETNVVVTSTTCNTLTATGCTVGANGPYVKNLLFSGSPSGSVTVTVAISPGHDKCIANSTGQTLNVGGGSGTTVTVPTGTGVSSAAAICITTFDGTNYVQNGSNSGAAGALGTLQVAGASGALASTGVQGFEYNQVPRGLLSKWFLYLHNALNAPVNVAIYGDSFNICSQPICGSGGGPTVSTNRWPEQMRIYLQQKFGSNGTGMVPLTYAASTSLALNPAAYTSTGTLDSNTSALGPTQTVNPGNTLVHLATGATVTFNDSRSIKWDTLHVYGATSSGSGTLICVADGSTSLGTLSTGSASASGATNGGFTARRWDLSALSLATHSVTCTASGDFYLYAFQGTAGSSGVSINLVAVGGATMTMFGASPTNQLTFTDLLFGGTQLVTMEDQTNDAAFSVSPSTFASDEAAFVAHEQALSSAPSVGIIIPPVDVVGASALAPYTAQQLLLCQGGTTACTNVQDRWGATYVSGSGYWDLTGAQPGTHPNDAGAIDTYSAVYAAFVDPVPFGSASPVASITTTGAGPATLNGGVLNIPPLTAYSSPDVIWASNEGSGSSLFNTGWSGSNTATATNVTWGSTSGFTGSVAQYNGTSSYAVAANQNQTNFDGTTGFSACATVNLTSTGPTDQRIMSTVDVSGTITGWDMEVAGPGSIDSNPGHIAVILANNFGSNAIRVYTAANSVIVSTTNLVCFSYDGSKTAAGVKVYVNSVPLSTTIASDTLTGSIANSNPVMIGALKNGAGQAAFLGGAIGDVRIYGRNLLPSEFQNIYVLGPNPIVPLVAYPTGCTTNCTFNGTTIMATISAGTATTGVRVFAPSTNLVMHVEGSNTANTAVGILNNSTGGLDWALESEGSAASGAVSPGDLATSWAPSSGGSATRVSRINATFGQYFLPLGIPVTTVAGLASLTGLPAGSQVVVSDATTFTPGACVGSGSDTMIAVYNGSTWSCH